MPAPSMRFPVSGLLEFGVYGSDLDAMERFYRDVFGLERIARADDRLIALRCGGSALLLFDPSVTRGGGAIPSHGPSGAGHLAFVIEDGERAAWRVHLERHGVPIEREVEWEDGGASIYVRDPAGNSVELAPPTIWGGLGYGLIREQGITSNMNEHMNITDTIRERRSIKKFTDRQVTREEIETLLDAAVLAPNHRMTEPWRFYVLGPGARRAYGLALGGRKARKVEDPEAAQAVREKVAREHEALPGVIAVAMVQDENPEIRTEDYATVMMAVQNISLAAVELGLGTHIKTGAVMDDPAARDAIGVADDERVVTILNIGEPVEVPSPKRRAPAASHTTWVP